MRRGLEAERMPYFSVRRKGTIVIKLSKYYVTINDVASYILQVTLRIIWSPFLPPAGPRSRGFRCS